jgi:hypothetical protein
VLSEFEVSPAKQWRLDMPPSVNTFSFVLYVSAPVQHPNGWVTLDPSLYSMPALDVKNIGVRVHDKWGRVDSTAVPTVNSADASIAAVGPAVYQPGTGAYSVPVIGLRSGTVAINTSAVDSLGNPMSPGAVTMNIGGIQRIWRGTASTDYNLPANWRPRRPIPPPFDADSLTILPGVPSSVDTAVVNGDSATQMPVMAQNNTVGGVILQPGALVPSINLGSFDYSLTSSIDHGSTGVILGTGRMIFTGTAKTISGGVSNVDYRNARFTGSYSLSEGTNMNVTGGRIVVQGGRLRNERQRIRVRPN